MFIENIGEERRSPPRESVTRPARVCHSSSPSGPQRTIANDRASALPILPSTFFGTALSR
jgi:hypothetical protein